MANVKILNEAGTGVIADGITNNQPGDTTITVTNIVFRGAAQIQPPNEYQIEFPLGQRTGRMCIRFNLATNTADFQ